MMSSSFAGISLLIRMIDCGDLLNGCGRFAPERAFSCGHLVKHNANENRSVHASKSFPSACSGDI